MVHFRSDRTNPSSLAGARLSRALCACCAALAVQFAAAAAPAGQATISWDARRESAVAGYKLFFGPAGKPFPPPIDVGKVSTHTMNGLDPALAYRAAVSTYDIYGQQSPLSAEVFFTAAAEAEIGATEPLEPGRTLLFADDFSDGAGSYGGGDGPRWETVLGEWWRTGDGSYGATSGTGNLALIAVPDVRDVRSGRIETAVFLSSAAAPEAAIVFHYRDGNAYRYLWLTPNGLGIAQAGEFFHERGGEKTRVAADIETGVWHRVRLDIKDGALVTVFIDEDETPALTFLFEAAASGGAGLWAPDAGSLFDDVAVWEDSALR